MGSSSRPSFASSNTSFVGAAASAILLACLGRGWLGMGVACLCRCVWVVWVS